MVANAGAIDPQDVQDTVTPPATSGVAQEAVPAEAEGPRCRQEHVLSCQFDRWYPLFKHCTPRSVVLELPEDLVRYLQEDGVVLPKGFEMSCGRGVQDDSDDEVDWGEGDDEEDADSRVRAISLLVAHGSLCGNTRLSETAVRCGTLYHRGTPSVVHTSMIVFARLFHSYPSTWSTRCTRVPVVPSRMFLCVHA